MSALHIVQGGIVNADKAWLEKAAKKKLDSETWIVPKSAKPGDVVVIYVTGYGFFATANIKSVPKPSPDWPNRYSAGLTSVRLIKPAISLGTIRRKIPELTWAIYPRSITTPDTSVSNKVKALIRSRRKNGITDLDDDALIEANTDELRRIALLRARRSSPPKERKAIHRARSVAIKLYVLRRSNGFCEGCKEAAPFKRSDGSPYLEPHHTLRLADDGPDHPAHVIALCPNCHRRAHYAVDARAFNGGLIEILSDIEPKDAA